jgi:small multidrug resistance pump
MPYILLFLSILIAVFGQTLFKIGTDSHSSTSEAFWTVFFVPTVFFGLALYFLSALIYIQALKTIPLSIAYPSLSLSYVIVVLLGVFLFNETLQKGQVFGLLMIISGVVLLWVKK